MFGPPGTPDVTVPYSLRFGIHGVGMVRRSERDFIVLLTPLMPKAPEQRLDETDLLDPSSDQRAKDAVSLTL